MVKKLVLLLATSLFFPLSLFAFSEADIISPRSGTWGNVQALVLNVYDGSYVYYSITGSDPLEQGFAYDGPVVIDASGPVQVNIAAVEKDGTRRDFSVQYLVIPSRPKNLDDEALAFVEGVERNPIRLCSSGSSLSIPRSLTYCMDNNLNPYITGRTLSISEANVLDRYVPCTMTNGTVSWHFVIHVAPPAVQTDSSASLPFEITDWTTFTFTGKNLIYRIDDGYWTGSSQSMELDRSVSHVISWQSLEYSPGNPIESVTLPAKPRLVQRRTAVGSTEFFLENGAGCQIGAASKRPSAGTIVSKPSSTITVDTVYGDSMGGSILLGVYSDGLFLGNLSASLLLDRRPPATPVISSSSKKSFARDQVVLRISAEKGSEIFYAVSEPVVFDNGFEGSQDEVASSVVVGDYSLYDGKSIVLKSQSQSATFYKVSAFCRDSSDNVSSFAEYRVVVDEFNYYLNASAKGSSSAKGDGTYGNPFTSLEQAVAAINTTDYMKLHIVGDVELSEGLLSIQSDCTIIGGGSVIRFPSESALEVNGCKVNLVNCVLEKKSPAASVSSKGNLSSLMLMVRSANLTCTGCELIGLFSESGILVDARSSDLTFSSTGLTSQAVSYSCALSADESEVHLVSSRLTSCASTCVGVSVSGGTLELKGSSFSILGRIGRIAELVRNKASIVGNVYTLSLENAVSQSEYLWKDADTVITENLGNQQR